MKDVEIDMVRFRTILFTFLKLLDDFSCHNKIKTRILYHHSAKYDILIQCYERESESSFSQ